MSGAAHELVTINWLVGRALEDGKSHAQPRRPAPPNVGPVVAGTFFDPAITHAPERITQDPVWRVRVNSTNEGGICPLSFAGARNDVRSVRVLIAAGARPNQIDSISFQPGESAEQTLQRKPTKQ